MQIQQIAIDALKPNPRNARTHPKQQIVQLVANIRLLGFLVPILADENGAVLAGHARLLAAKQAGLSVVPVIFVRGLSEAKKRALMLADNKIAENAGWNSEILAIELQALVIAIENRTDHGGIRPSGRRGARHHVDRIFGAGTEPSCNGPRGRLTRPVRCDRSGVAVRCASQPPWRSLAIG